MSDPADREPTGAGPLPDPEGHDDLSPTARTLRDALAARAAGVAPTDRLEEIRMSTQARRRVHRTRATLAVAAAVVVAAGATFAVTRGGDDDVTTVAASPTASASAPATTDASAAPSTPAPAATSAPAAATPAGTASPSSAASSTGTGSTSALPSGSSAVPVYWLGTGSPKLFREFVAAPAGTDDPTRALRAMLAGGPADPDYTSPWRADATATVSSTDGRLVVDLAASAASGSAGGATATAAVQQLVYTVTAAAGEDLPVQIRVAGASTPTLFGQRVAETVSRAPQADVQAPAWITAVTPTAGGVTVKGVGTGFEGTLLYTVTDAAGAEVARNSVQAGANGTYAEFSTTIDLPAGTYTVSVFAPDESDGEGAAPLADTKGFTVS